MQHAKLDWASVVSHEHEVHNGVFVLAATPGHAKVAGVAQDRVVMHPTLQAPSLEVLGGLELAPEPHELLSHEEHPAAERVEVGVHLDEVAVGGDRDVTVKVHWSEAAEEVFGARPARVQLVQVLIAELRQHRLTLNGHERREAGRHVGWGSGVLAWGEAVLLRVIHHCPGLGAGGRKEEDSEPVLHLGVERDTGEEVLSHLRQCDLDDTLLGGNLPSGCQPRLVHQTCVGSLQAPPLDVKVVYNGGVHGQSVAELPRLLHLDDPHVGDNHCLMLEELAPEVHEVKEAKGDDGLQNVRGAPPSELPVGVHHVLTRHQGHLALVDANTGCTELPCACDPLILASGLAHSFEQWARVAFAHVPVRLVDRSAGHHLREPPDHDKFLLKLHHLEINSVRGLLRELVVVVHVHVNASVVGVDVV
mmetsp:Transcript_37269/g.51713  ORF Transcript_37269/g.51713 Transcript_37269/m.51713 type:complete len:419 (-) Transcript_37269:1339-2595(-)